MTDWLVAFLLTQSVEGPIYARALGGRVGLALGASALTHPLVYFAFPRLFPGDYAHYFWAAEGFAVVVEALWLRVLGGVEGAFALSLRANAASVFLGTMA